MMHERYRHYKGDLYKFICLARTRGLDGQLSVAYHAIDVNSKKTITIYSATSGGFVHFGDSEYVIYQSVATGEIWGRPRTEFESTLLVDNNVIERFKACT